MEFSNNPLNGHPSSQYYRSAGYQESVSMCALGVVNARLVAERSPIVQVAMRTDPESFGFINGIVSPDVCFDCIMVSCLAQMRELTVRSASSGRRDYSFDLNCRSRAPKLQDVSMHAFNRLTQCTGRSMRKLK